MPTTPEWSHVVPGASETHFWGVKHFNMLLPKVKDQQARGGHSIVKLKTTCEQKNLLFLSCITKIGQTFIKKNSWVGIHGIYYILVKIDTQNS